MATPGKMFPDFLRVIPIIPAIPPVKAIITSHILGAVLDKISLPALDIGLKEK